MVTASRVALWIRVSTEEQDATKQHDQLEAWAADRGFEVVQIFLVHKSAWRGEHHPALAELYAGASRGEFSKVLVAALDRLGREGPAATIQIWSRLRGHGCEVLSHREPWAETGSQLPAFTELLVSFAGWLARAESDWISDRTKKAMAAAKKRGQHMGRPKGAKDKGPRRRLGYFERWDGKTRRRSPAAGKER